MSSTPSAILSDALAAFNKAATLAITTTQDRARKDVTKATSDTREALRERDEAIKALHAGRLEEQAWKQEASIWKATADQAELMIKHHLETISQLRQEATQWKEQCLRLEETSRREAISWKEQFLRVEQERSKLSQKLDEMISGIERPLTSTPASAPMPHSTAQKPWKSRDGLPTPASETRVVTRLKAGRAIPSSRPVSMRSANDDHQVVLRRVQATIEVPLKEEDVDLEDWTISPPESASCRVKRGYVEIDHSCPTASGPSEPGDARGSAAPSEDDELIMGAEDKPTEAYGTKHARKSLISTSSAPSSGRKKRKSAGVTKHPPVTA